MRQHKTPAHLDALRYLADSTDAPTAARETATAVLRDYDRASKTLHAEQEALNTALAARRSAERDALPTLWAQLTAGKKPSLDAIVQHKEVTTAQVATCEQRLYLARRLAARAELQVTGAAIQPHKDDLLLWIGTRRHAHPVACGAVETLPEQVQVIYDALDVVWDSNWDSELMLQTSRVPLMFDATWPADFRASVTWVWEQVAQGNIARVPHHRDSTDNAELRHYRPTQRVVRLPAVPPTPKTPTLPPSFALVVG